MEACSGKLTVFFIVFETVYSSTVLGDEDADKNGPQGPFSSLKSLELKVPGTFG